MNPCECECLSCEIGDHCGLESYDCFKPQGGEPIENWKQND
jgi:hypothetical protein